MSDLPCYRTFGCKVGGRTVPLTLLDPDFGFKTKGTTYTAITNKISGSHFPSGGTGTAESITAYISNGGYSSKFKFALYKHSDNSFVGGTEEKTLSIDGGWAGAWQTLNFLAPKPNILNIEYWIEAWTNYGAMWFSAGVAGKAGIDTETYDGWPDPLVPSLEAKKFSIYCTYSTAPPPAAPGVTQPYLVLAKGGV